MAPPHAADSSLRNAVPKAETSAHSVVGQARPVRYVTEGPSLTRAGTPGLCITEVYFLARAAKLAQRVAFTIAPSNDNALRGPQGPLVLAMPATTVLPTRNSRFRVSRRRIGGGIECCDQVLECIPFMRK